MSKKIVATIEVDDVVVSLGKMELGELVWHLLQEVQLDYGNEYFAKVLLNLPNQVEKKRLADSFDMAASPYLLTLYQSR